jgi:GntR family transcriptional regulator/MocR family aminotransferase
MLDVVPSQSGLHTIGLLHRSLAEAAIAQAAELRQITASPIARYSIAPTGVRGLVLGFGGIRPAEIEAGVATLGEVLEHALRQVDRA